MSKYINPFASLPTPSFETPAQNTTETTPLQPVQAVQSPATRFKSFFTRQTGLEAKERELRQREAELAAREARLQPVIFDRRKNFPICYPVIYHNIEVEIPPHLKRLCIHHYRGWWIFVVGLLTLNSFGCLFVMTANASGMNTAASNFGSSVFYMLLVSFLSFWTWYRPIYKALMNNSGLQYMIFFIFNGFHIAFNFYMLLGFPGSGSAGAITMVAMFSASKVFAGLTCAFITALWLIGLFYWIALWKKTHGIYRDYGHSLEKAQTEAITSAATSGALQSAIKSSNGFF